MKMNVRQPGDEVAVDLDSMQQIVYTDETDIYVHTGCVGDGELVDEAILSRLNRDGTHSYQGCRRCGVKFGKVKLFPRDAVPARPITESMHFL